MGSFVSDSIGGESISSQVILEETISEEVEAVHDLLEENWFFGKCHKGNKSRMLRCYSDPSPRFDQESSTKNPGTRKSPSSSAGMLVRAPSLPEKYAEKASPVSRNKNELTRQLSEISFVQEPKKPVQPTTCVNGIDTTKRKGIDNRRSGTNVEQQLYPRHNLLRAPSLPPNIGRETEEVDGDDESDVSMSRLIRQAMPCSSGMLPRRHAAQGRMQLPSTPQYRPPRNLEAESTSTNTNTLPGKEPTRGNPSQRRLQRCMSNLEFQQMQGFKDLGFKFDKGNSCLSPSTDAAPNHTSSTRPLYRQQSCALPIPICADKNSAEDMKEQIKFWARAVASNVR